MIEGFAAPVILIPPWKGTRYNLEDSRAGDDDAFHEFPVLTMKLRLLRSLALLSPIFAGVIGMNVAVAPANLWSGRVKAAAASLLRGLHLTGTRNLNERQLQKEVVKGLPAAPELLVLGSSRSMEIHSTFFPGVTLRNASVSRATLEDLIILSELYRDRGMIPRTVILGADPWLFNPAFNSTRWRDLQREYLRAARRLGLSAAGEATRWRYQMRRWGQLLSPSYFQSSVQSLLAGETTIVARPEIQGDGQYVLKDGSIWYPSAYRNRSTQEVDQRVDRILADSIYSLKGMTGLDPARCRTWERYLDSLSADGIRIVFWMAPYHPKLYQHLKSSPQYRGVLQAEDYLRELAARRGIQILGSYDPGVLGAGPDQFYDEEHPRQALVQGALQLLKPRP